MFYEKDTIKHIIGLVASAGLTMATTSGSNIIAGLVNTIASGVLGSYVNNLNYNKLKGIIQDIDPEDLNHDIKKIIIYAVENCIKIICDTYTKRYFLKDYQKLRLNDFEKQLLNEIRGLKDKIYGENDSIYRQIENPQSVDQLFELFNLSVDNFPDVNAKYPFGTYFKNEFIPMLQLSFGELLKDEKSRPALIAYQRDVYQTLDKKLDLSIEQNNLILDKLSSPSEKVQMSNFNDSLVKVKYEISSKKESATLLPEFEQQIESYYETIRKDVAEVLTGIGEIKEGINRNWLLKHKVYVISIGVLLSTIIVFQIHRINTQPFDMVISIKKEDHIHREYPPIGKHRSPKVRIDFPNGEPVIKELTSDRTILINDIPNKYLDKEITITFDDKYYTFTKERLKLEKSNKIVYVRPNNYLSNVEGFVYTLDSGLQRPQSNIKISSPYYALETVTDSLGLFSIEIPMEYRKEYFTLKIDYHNQTFIKTCIVGSGCDIRIDDK
ncbi:hypothetical protein [Winogradskyella sp. R77965]|uniref:hypothetical protein n=1 Tax=Winogradskyella sp. R77965 TaxID=3093872 RepID=UPI0037DD4B80